ncbi:MAG: YncE family protein, partial [Blastocatellia bacterium]
MTQRLRLSHSRVKRSVVLIAALLGIGSWFISRPQVTRVRAQSTSPAFQSFEAPQIHPLAITPDGTRLLACNTHNNSLSVFQLMCGTPTLSIEIPTGLQPVSVAARNNGEAWVANWLSNTISVVDLSAGNVVRTIDVGYQPTDVVFAGQTTQMAFVCVAGTAQVLVFDPNAPTTSPQVINIRGKQPRSLATDPSGARVFVSVFESGNQTTIVPATEVAREGGLPKPQPKKAKGLPAAPATSLIVKWNGSAWADQTGNTKWNQVIPYTLADVDLVVLDASKAAVTISEEVHGVGTHIGNAVLDPATEKLYVANTDSLNNVRFLPNLKGHFASNRVSIINFGSSSPAVTAVDI